MEEDLIKEKDEKKEDNEELPEEGEITDDEEEKNRKTIKQQKEFKQNLEEIQELSPNNSPEYQSFTNSGRQQIINSGGLREFQRGGSSSWRKSFAGHHGGSGRGGSFSGSKFSRGGIDTTNVQYRDFDGRVSMKNNDQQEEEMLDSWNACIRGGIRHHNYRRGGRINSPDISPIRTSPMIKEDNEEKDFNLHPSSDLPTKKQIITGEQHHLDDDKDFRAMEAEDTIKSSSNSPQHKSSPRQQYSDDNDFRRSSTQQQPQHSNLNRETPPPLGFSEGRQLEKNRRRHRSQSPPLNISARSQFQHESEDFDISYGNSAKRYRQLYENGPSGGDGFTIKDENLENSPSFDENGPWSSHAHRSGDDSDFNHYFNYGGDRSGRGGRTQGWGYRGGRPFFPRLICKFFREGFCRDGDHCTFSHLTGDSHRRPELCRYYQQGYCKKGLFCQLMHGEWPCKAFHKGECSKEQCSFSHEPLDDVSRPIMDKILEEERLGLTRPQPQQHTRFDNPQQQSFHLSGNIRPFFRPTRFQGPYQNQSMQSGGSSFSQSQTPQPPHLMTHQQFNRNPHQQKGLTSPSNQQQPFFKHQQPIDESFVTGIQIPAPPTEISVSNEEIGGICQQQPSIPPPGLVMPPPLGGGSPLPLPSNSSSATFGFFNPVSSTPSGNQSSQVIQSQPPSFQQLQQQVQQVAVPHFPHQPSLLGPSSAVAQAQAMLTAILQHSQQQQMGSAPMRGDIQDNSLQRSPPPPPPPKKDEILRLPSSECQPTKTELQETDLKTNTGGFNINQMLEQITQQNSLPQPPVALTIIKQEEANTLDLLANVGLSEETNIIEESPASPVFADEQHQEIENKPASLIPVLREWKLHLLDLTPLTESSDMHFDIKLVQQISSSNSDPRLRKIAEKQFDLVSRTLEQHQQANQQKLNSNEDLILSSNISFSTDNKQFTSTEQMQKEIKDQELCERYEVGVIDPRTTDPRRRNASGQIIESNKTLKDRINSTTPDEAELVKKQMAALEEAAKQQQNFEQPSQLFGTHVGIRQQIGLTPPINFQIPPPAFLPVNPIANTFFNLPPPPLSQQVPQNFSAPPPSAYQQQTTHQIGITKQPKLEAQTFTNEQIACSSSSSSMDSSNKQANNSFEKSRCDDSSFPSFQYSGGGYRGRRGRYSHNHHHYQQHYREHNTQTRRSESPPKQPQQQEQISTSSTNISLREKRKNNEYESPLARMAGNRY